MQQDSIGLGIMFYVTRYLKQSLDESMTLYDVTKPHLWLLLIHSLKPRQNSHHFADDILTHFLEWCCSIFY